MLKKVESFLEAIVEADSEFQCRHTIGMGLTRSSNANAGIDADFIEIAAFPLLVSEDSKTQADITKNFRYSYIVNQDLKHPRGDTVNYIFSLTDERLAKFDRFDMSTAVISINRIFNLEENSFFSRPFINTSVTGFMVLLADKALLSSQQYRLEFGSALSDQHFLSIGSYYDKRNFLMNDSKSGHINGLNLTIETLEGLLKHNGPIQNLNLVDNLIGIKRFKNMINFKTYPPLEAQISAISDDIAYNNHDIQDGINANIFKLEELIEINFFKDIYKKYRKKINKKNYKIATYQIIRDSIDLMIKDLIKNTNNNLKLNKVKNLKDINKTSFLMVDFSNKVKNSESEIRYFLKTKMYNNQEVLAKNDKGKLTLKKLFYNIKKNPGKFIPKDQLDKDKYRAISDFVSGMTDRYAINLYKNLT